MKKTKALRMLAVLVMAALVLGGLSQQVKAATALADETGGQDQSITNLGSLPTTVRISVSGTSTVSASGGGTASVDFDYGVVGQPPLFGLSQSITDGSDTQPYGGVFDLLLDIGATLHLIKHGKFHADVSGNGLAQTSTSTVESIQNLGGSPVQFQSAISPGSQYELDIAGAAPGTALAQISLPPFFFDARTTNGNTTVPFMGPPFSMTLNPGETFGPVPGLTEVLARAIPEPSCFVLFGIGGIGIIGCVRRRRKHTAFTNR